MASNMKVKRGDSTDIYNITVEGVSDYTDYRGEVTILDSDNEVVFPKVVIAPNEGKVSIALTPTQTATLEVGSYNMVCEIIKEEDGIVTFRREMNWPIEILPSLINN